MNGNGVKFDGGKPRMDLIPPYVLIVLGKLYAMGANKYGDRNWEDGMKWTRLKRAADSHLALFWEGKWIDRPKKYSKDSKDTATMIPHIIQAIWNLVGLAYYSMNRDVYGEFDDRSSIAKEREAVEIEELKKEGAQLYLKFEEE